MSILVTGAAGFIGSSLCNALLQSGHEVIGVDNLNSYYDPALKEARLERLRGREGFTFERLDLTDPVAMEGLRDRGIGPIVHLAAQAGVRYSITHPFVYADANLTAWLEVLELARAVETPHLLLASSSSVYGANEKLPFSSADTVDRPLSLYAATKRAGELLAHSYAHLYEIPTSITRLFTVYGPWGRPDMALWLFAEAIQVGSTIELFNEGKHRRDFTYIDDVVKALQDLIEHPATPCSSYDPLKPAPDVSSAPFRIYNIGNDTSVELVEFVDVIEQALGQRTERRLVPMQPGDVEASLADIGPIREAIGWSPSTSIDVGVPRFVAWLKEWQARPQTFLQS